MKNRVKFAIIILIVIMTLNITACNVNDIASTPTPEHTPTPEVTPTPEPEPTPEPTPNPTPVPGLDEIEIIQPRRGMSRGNVYSSEYLDVHIVIPRVINTVHSEDELLQYNQERFEFFEEIPESFWEEQNFFVDFLATVRMGGSASASMRIEIRKLPEWQLNFDSPNYIIDWVSMRQSTLTGTDSDKLTHEINDTPFQIGDNKWYSYTEDFLSIDERSRFSHDIVFINVYGGFAREIRFTYASTTDVQPDSVNHDELISILTAQVNNYIGLDADIIVSWITPYP